MGDSTPSQVTGSRRIGKTWALFESCYQLELLGFSQELYAGTAEENRRIREQYKAFVANKKLSETTSKPPQ
jgi:hypothetical protein